MRNTFKKLLHGLPLLCTEDRNRMKDIIQLRSTKIGVDDIRRNYKEPIEAQKVKLADGVFLCDPLLGTAGLFAEEIEPGVYESMRLPGHLMYEEGVIET